MKLTIVALLLMSGMALSYSLADFRNKSVQARGFSKLETLGVYRPSVTNAPKRCREGAYGISFKGFTADSIPVSGCLCMVSSDVIVYSIIENPPKR